MKHVHTLLIVDDDQDTRELLSMRMEMEGFETMLASDGHEALDRMSDNVSVVLLDLIMPGMGGLDTLKEIRSRHKDARVIIVTAINELDEAVAAVKAGAFHYVTKPVNMDLLLSLVRQAIQSADLENENQGLMEVLGSSVPSDTFVGGSAQYRDLMKYVGKIAHLDSTVLITGESGVGKGLMARLVHYKGNRAAKPFVTVSCSAMPRDLVESELFGHEKGAFTGAYKTRPGRLEICDGGTLFLDEIGDLPLDLQPKLLTFLQDRYFSRVGGNRSISVDVRIVAATNRNLEVMCRDGQFREDLYYRLNVLPLHIAPLRERVQDIPLIATHILGKIARRREVEPYRLSDEAAEAMMAHRWSGNIRELENILERATALCEDGVIGMADIASMVSGGLDADAPPGSDGGDGHLPSLSLDELEVIAIRQALTRSKGNKTLAAQMLGISKKSIYNKMKRFEIV